MSDNIIVTYGGPQGAAGTMMVWKGAYSAETTYAAGDGVVSSEGRGFVALQATTGNAPPSFPTTINTYWSLFAEKGLGDIKSDGSVPFTGAIDSDVATGTAPLTIASTTVVTNLNADTVDGEHLPTSGVGNAQKVMRVSVGGAFEVSDSLALAGALTVATEKTDHQIMIPVAPGAWLVGTWTASASSNVLIVTRTAATGTGQYRMPIRLPIRTMAGKGSKLKSVTVCYTVGSADAINDQLLVDIIKQTMPKDGNSPVGSILAGNDDADYDEAHNTKAKRLTAGTHTLTVTIPIGEQAYAADGEQYYIDILPTDAATANMTFVLKGVVANYSAAEY